MSSRVMILGAGSTGRGHIGELCHEAGWELVLVDKNPDLVGTLRSAGRYGVSLYGPDGCRQVTVDRFRACHVGDAEAITREALGVPLILTSLFSQNLPEVAPLLAAIISARHDAGVEQPLNVICCENMQNSSTMLKSLVEPLLGTEAAQYAAAMVGFPDAMVSRVVPLATADPLAMTAEDYNEWTVDAAGFVGPPLELLAMELVTNQEARLGRKFFMHNSGHAICGYWGFHRGYTYIHEAVADAFVLDKVVNCMGELAQVVSRRYGLGLESVMEYGLELGRRGAVAELQDAILRVVRDPLRKLARDERLVAPAEMALQYGLPCGEIVGGIAAVLHYYHPDDPQAVTMRRMLSAGEPRTAVSEMLGLPEDHRLVGLVMDEHEAWAPPDAV